MVLNELASFSCRPYSGCVGIDATAGIEPSARHKEIDQAVEVFHVSRIAVDAKRQSDLADQGRNRAGHGVERR